MVCGNHSRWPSALDRRRRTREGPSSDFHGKHGVRQTVLHDVTDALPAEAAEGRVKEVASAMLNRSPRAVFKLRLVSLEGPVRPSLADVPLSGATSGVVR